MKIILDTNFLIAVAQFKIDIFEQLRGNRLYTLYAVLEELNKLSVGTSKSSRAAKLALTLIRAKSLKVLKSKLKADASLVHYAEKGYAIATQDRILQQKIKRVGAKVIYIRQRKYVII